MPTRTWSNLDPARRDRVIEAARVEFGRHGYSRGSLNVIARDAGVAKGSLFQYFTDKFDFYAYVADHCARTVQADLAHLLERPPGTPLAEHLTGALDAWVRYFAEHPVERGLTVATHLELDPEARTAIREPVHRRYVDALRPLFARAVEDGELGPDADLDVLVAMLIMLLQHLATAPFTPGIDPVLGLYGRSPDELRTPIRRLVGTLLHGGPTGTAAAG